MSNGIDVDQLTNLIVEELRRRAGEWVSFVNLARKVRGDAADAGLIGAIVDNRKDLFVVHADRIVKLKFEAFAHATSQPETQPVSHAVAAQLVRQYARNLRPFQIRVQVAHPGQRVLDRFLHALEVDLSDDSMRFADDTPVELLSVSGRRNFGHITGISRDEERMYVAFQNEVWPDDVPAMMYISRSKPLLGIASWLEGLRNSPSRAESLMHGYQGSHLEDSDSGLIAVGLSRLGVPWSRMLWGPPGSGKTYCSAALCKLLLRSNGNDRVLLVAPSNVAVDAALIELVTTLDKDDDTRRLLQDRKIIRLGYPRDGRVLARAELFGPPDLESLSEEIKTAQSHVQSLARRRATEVEIAAARAVLRQLQERLKQRLERHLLDARLVATTITSAFMGEQPIVGTGQWQTVIADEASMINGATVLALASASGARFLLVGDPRQLAPIFEWDRREEVSADMRRWLAKDPYELVGLSTGVGTGKRIVTADPRMARVLAQRRCHPRIWAFVSDLYPAVVSQVDLERTEIIAQAPPLPGEPSVLVDLSDGVTPRGEVPETEAFESLSVKYVSACRRVGRTWENPPTALRAIHVARRIAEVLPTATIAIITPYRGQVRLLRRLLDFEREQDTRLRNLEVGTVHSFQGGEADAVIFDIVDGPPRPDLGMLLKDDTGSRLVNVAVTRARGKLVLIAHSRWMRERNRERAGKLWDFLFPDGLILSREKIDIPRRKLDEQPATAFDGSGAPESPIEELFLLELQRRREELPPFVLQHRIVDSEGQVVSRADIAFVDQKLAVYCDGARYHLQKDQWERDLRQRRKLTALGWRFLAFSGSEIVSDVSRCVDDVVATVL